MRGNPGKRALNKAEPKPPPLTVAPPDHLDADAKAEWGRLVPLLTRMRVLTEADYMALANLCSSWSTMITAQKQIQTAGMLYKSQKTNYVQISPLWTIVQQSMKQVNEILKEFGMTPAARTKVQTVPGKPAESDPWDEGDKMRGGQLQ